MLIYGFLEQGFPLLDAAAFMCHRPVISQHMLAHLVPGARVATLLQARQTRIPVE